MLMPQERFFLLSMLIVIMVSINISSIGTCIALNNLRKPVDCFLFVDKCLDHRHLQHL